MKTDFYKRYEAGCSGKYPNYENLLHHCSIAKLIIMYVLQKYLQTISSVLSCDGHLKPVCVCKFAHNYEHCDHSSLGCRFVLSNVWYESYLREEFDEYIL